MKTSLNTSSNFFTIKQGKGTDIYAFLKAVRHLKPISNKSIVVLLNRFQISPDSLTLLIEIQCREGVSLWN